MALAPALDLRPANDESAAAAISAEQALIGLALFDNEQTREASHLNGSHFYEGGHGRAWEAIRALVAAGRDANPATLADRMAGDLALEGLGGRDYLFRLLDRADARLGMARQHAESILGAFTRREAARLLGDASKALLSHSEADAFSILGPLKEDLARLEQSAGCGGDRFITADTAAQALLDALDDEADHGRERGAMTGLRCFDRRLRGLRPGWLIVIGGRPSMAKSGLMRAAAYGCATRNPESAVAIFSLEMEAREVAERAISAASFLAGDGIPYVEFGRGLTYHQRMTLRGLGSPPNVYIDDSASIGLEEISRRVWALKSKGPLAAIFIDYLQLMRRPAAQGRNDALVLGDMTTGLKRLARDAEIAVVLLSQLNRQVESRDDKRPQLADLRDSGSIEQDANAVLFPYREAYYLERAEPKDQHSAEHLRWETSLEMVRRRMDVIAAKVRGGKIGTDRQAYFAEFDHVEDVAE